MSENRFAALRERQPEPQQLDIENDAGTTAPAKTTTKPKPARASKPEPVSARATGKSSNPDYERLTVYVRKETKQRMARELIGTEDDMSDLLQRLLDKHLGK